MSSSPTAFRRVYPDMATSDLNNQTNKSYARPQDPWICGRLAEGRPCTRGPDGRGQCQGGSECQPWFNNDRWECRRSDQQGGPCDQGPLPDGTCCRAIEPCVPVPALRTRRKTATRWAVALAVGLVALILAGGIGNELLMPGPLTSSHANLGDCQACHATTGATKLGWLHNLTKAADPQENAKLCIRCHEMGKSAFAAHTHPVEDLKRLTSKAAAISQTSPFGFQSVQKAINFSLPAPQTPASKSEIYCATCHEEHEGPSGDLMAVSDNRCQTCHVNRFDAFSQSHPQFSDYPIARRTRIIFDHKSHFSKHYPKTRELDSTTGSAPGYCSDCHAQGSDRKYMEISSFGAMCSECHADDIRSVNRASGPKGVDFLTVPGLDLVVLEESGIDIGEWPEDSEADVTPFMRSLLASISPDKDVVDAISKLDLLDLTDASGSDLSAVSELAWAVKKLFQRIETSGLRPLMKLPPNSDGTEVDHLQLGQMSAVMPHDVISSANRDWFPNLSDDLRQHEAGKQTQYFAAMNENGELPAPPAGSQPETPDDGSLGDDLLETDNSDLLEDALSLESSDPGENALSLEGDAEENGDDILSGLVADDSLEEDSLESGEILVQDSDQDILETSGDDDILGEDPDTSENALLLSDEGDEALLSDEIPLDDASGGRDAAQTGGTDTAVQTSDTIEPDPESWADLGGWYRQDFAVRFRPPGHADRFLRAWLTFSGHAYGTAAEKHFAPVFEKLSPADAVGRCTKCHSVDDEGDRKHVKWRAFSTKRVKDRFTTFSHEPHVGAEISEGCATCHKLTEGSGGFLQTYKAGDPDVFSLTFEPIDKSVCSACHTKKAAGEECTLCHQYHTVDIGHPMNRTRIPPE